MILIMNILKKKAGAAREAIEMHLSRGDWLAAEQHFSYCRAKKREGVGKMLFVLPKNTYSIVWPPYRTNTIIRSPRYRV
jgi:hypothetical protein